ncbi:MAG: PAS-domain containing protein [Candidatus Odyssella sp.]|nr:PAS-domain containing protein [Candidatus Odyssella sp.]
MTKPHRPPPAAAGSAQALQVIIDNMSQGLLVLDAGLCVVAYNPVFRALFDLPEELLRASPPLASIIRFQALRGDYGPGAVDEQIARRVGLFEQRMPFHREIERPDRQALELRCNTTPDDWLVLTFTDVSERRRREKETAATATALRAILDNMAQGLMLLDRDLRIVAHNPMLLRIMDLPGELLATKPLLADVVRLSAARGDYGPVDVERQVADRIAVYRHGVPFREEIERPGGRIVEMRASRAPDDAIVATFTDVTELRRAEQHALAARDAAEAASRAKSDFLANMSHELRTPLNAIIGYSEAIAARLFGPIAARYAEYAGDIAASGQHLLEIIGDLLDLAKIEAGRMEIAEERLDLRALAEESLHMMRERAQRAGLAMALDSTARHTALTGDARAIRQILLNLVSNAIKFTAAGGTVTASIADAAEGGLTLAVADTGIGMAAHEIPKALEPFGQISGPMSRRHQGTGLGLPLVRSFAELHQAAMAIDSRPGIGTRVSITFPAARRPPPLEERAQA